MVGWWRWGVCWGAPDPRGVGVQMSRGRLRRWMLLCLSTREEGEVLLVAFGEFAVVCETSFEF